MDSNREKTPVNQLQADFDKISEEKDREKKEKKQKKKKKEKPVKEKPVKKKEKPVKEKKEKPVKEKKGSFMDTIIPSRLFKQINGYGYTYSFGKYMVSVLAAIGLMLLISYFLKLQMIYFIILVLFSLCCLPFIVLASFRHMHNSDNFEQLTTYMEQMIMAFKQRPKILMALIATEAVVEGDMKACVQDAIEIIKTDAKSVNVYERAFNVIESEFPTSRLKSLHKYMLDVERVNSQTYQESIDTLQFDVRSWITRTYKFQTELKSTKVKISIILGMSLAITCFFANVIVKMQNALDPESIKTLNADLNIISNPLFQISTLLYCMLMIMIYVIITSKLHGQWLINDTSHASEERINSTLKKIEEYETTGAVKTSVIAAVIGVVLTVVTYMILHKTIVLVLGALLVVFLAFKKKISYSSNRKFIERELAKEFPVWLREVSINLNNMVVVRAVQESLPGAVPVMRPFLNEFLERVEAEPNSFMPYLEFFGKFSATELSTAVKTLYSIKVMGKEDAQKQVNDLIMRNQMLLEEAEKARNEDALSGVSFISLIPMLLMSFKLILDMIQVSIMFFGLMGSSNLEI